MTYVVNTEQPHLGGNIPAGDSWTYCPRVWDYAVDRFGAQSVLDLGSGRGHASRYFARKGCAVIAIEGLELNVRHSLYPAVLFDLTHGPVIAPVDLVHCHEVVEHIDVLYLDNLVRSLMNGRIIIMTAAGPDQPGHHHVNLQPESYWIDLLTDHGCEYLADDSRRVRELATQDQAWHMARSGMVFYNERK